MSEPSPAPGEGTNAARASVTAVVGVLGAVGLLLLLVTWAASIGPDQVVTQSGNPPSYASITPSTTSTATAATTSNQRNHGSGDRDVLFTVVSIVATLLAAVVMLAALITFVRWLLVRTWRRGARDPEPDEVEFDPLDAPARMAGAMVADAAGQRQALVETGSARNAIVECWHRFEQQAEMAGVHRQRWETSSEFTLRVLDRLSADPRAVMTLAELYRDARHSRHEISEESRREATEALDAVHRSLGSRAGAT